MSRSTHTEPPAVPAEEVERRIAEYRRTALEGRLPPQVVYHPHAQACPWGGCDYRIAGIRFNLDTMGDAQQQEAWLTSWWQGPGLLAHCPGCRRLVLFGLEDKEAVHEPATTGAQALPEDWLEHAYLVPQSGR